MSNHEHETCWGSILLAFAAGAVIGAGIALLYAPQSGKETREMLAKKAGELKEATVEAYEKTVEKGAEIIDKGKEFVRAKKSQIAAAYEAGKEAYQEGKPKSDREVTQGLG
ncbi:MAG: YtxH domain-containing protein [bacterium]|nr:YtxH domain-containing protein [bacterium]